MTAPNNLTSNDKVVTNTQTLPTQQEPLSNRNPTLNLRNNDQSDNINISPSTTLNIDEDGYVSFNNSIWQAPIASLDDKNIDKNSNKNDATLNALKNTAVVYNNLPWLSCNSNHKCGCCLPLDLLVKVLPCTNCPKCMEHELVLIQDGCVYNSMLQRSLDSTTETATSAMQEYSEQNCSSVLQGSFVLFKYGHHFFHLSVEDRMNDQRRGDKVNNNNERPWWLLPLFPWDSQLDKNNFSNSDNASNTAQARIAQVLGIDLCHNLKIMHNGKIIYPCLNKTQGEISQEVIDLSIASLQQEKVLLHVVGTQSLSAPSLRTTTIPIDHAAKASIQHQPASRNKDNHTNIKPWWEWWIKLVPGHELVFFLFDFWHNVWQHYVINPSVKLLTHDDSFNYEALPVQ